MAYLSLIIHAMVLVLCLATLVENHRNHTDHFALLAIKSSVTQDPQHVLDSWNSSLHFCQWYGVTCGRRHRRIIILDLDSKGIVGCLPPQIGNLSFLRAIYLGDNTFKGVIPHQIGGLFRLRELKLVNNSFEGEVPASLSNCTRLSRLGLYGNKLSGRLPQQLSALVNLVYLAIHKYSFTGGIPPFLANFTSLESISAAHNHLGGSISHALGQLHNLEKVACAHCDLYGKIPSSLYNLTSLVVLSFSFNQIDGDLQKDIGLQLPNLELFEIAGNKFTGTIPFSFSNCSNLVELSLQTNSFTGKVNINFRFMPDLRYLGLFEINLGSSQYDDMNFIDSMTNCSRLEMLFVSANQLRGVLPTTVGNLSSHLTDLSFRQNFMYGSLPSGLGNLVKLERLSLGYNQFMGVLPNELGNLRNLKSLSVAYNNFNGNIPECLGDLPLLGLDMGSNILEGQIPPNLGKCKCLISENNLTDPIPPELFELSSLSILLDLSQNHLVGPLPQEMGKLKSLTVLDLSHNNLVGAIPEAVGSCTSVEYLYLNANSFQGSIPPSMSSLKGMRELYLSSNNFSGQIPRFLEQLNLSSLNLSFNHFNGKVPTGGIFKNTSAFEVDGNSRLCGGIPELGLPKCDVQTRSRKRSHKSYIALVFGPLFSFLVATIIFMWCFCSRRRKKAPPIGASLMHPFSRVSYRDILKATNGFSQRNLIGMGAFSVVYKGLFELEDTIVAIKVIKAGTPGALRSFMAECEALKSTRHRNLVKIITSCSSVDFQGNDFKALIYEYMPNGNLDRWLHPSLEQEAPQRLNRRQRMGILTDVAHAFHYLHQGSKIPIIHCDLKPSNILLDSDMVAHVSDIGMAKLLPFELNDSSSIGTIGYAAPEYSFGTKMTREGDIYSFGILLLEMMTGKRPIDQIFDEGLNLHTYVKMAFPDRFMTVIDPTLLHVLEEEMEAANVNRGYSNDRAKKWKILDDGMISLGRIGLACSMESPRDRIDTSKIIYELHHITGILNSVLSW